MSESRKEVAMYTTAAGCMWGTIGLSVNVVSGYGIRFLELTVSRMIVTAAILEACFLIRDRNLFRVRAGDLVWLEVAGILCLLFFNVSYEIAVERSSISTAAILLYTSPAFVTLIVVSILKEKLSSRKLVTILSAITGCAFVSGIISEKVTFPADAFLWGMGATLGYAMYDIVAGVLLKRYHPLTILFYAFLIAAATGCFLADMKHMICSISQYPQLGVVLVVSACVYNIFSHLSYNTAPKYMEAGRVPVVASIEPAVASFLGAAVLGESMDFYGASGVIRILGAIVVLDRQSGVEKHEGEASGVY